jgi:hypothetical protein
VAYSGSSTSRAGGASGASVTVISFRIRRLAVFGSAQTEQEIGKLQYAE